MSRMDPECFAAYQNNDERVCSACFEDEDLKIIIRRSGGPRGCDFCGRKDAPTAPFDELAEHIVERLNAFYGKAADQLPYESREGGYMGWHVDTYDLLMDKVGLSLPRDDDGRLLKVILN
jgi:HEPN superfamily RES-like protein